MSFSGSFSSFIQVFKFTKKFISSSFSSQEPTKSGEWCIHTASSIDSRSNLKSDDISVSLNLLSSFEKIPESNRFRLLHLSETEGSDDSIFIYYWHTVGNSSERCEVDVASESFLNSVTFYSDKYSMQQLECNSSTSKSMKRVE